jgi:hypothetical protein
MSVMEMVTFKVLEIVTVKELSRLGSEWLGIASTTP